jgi:two-component system sensor histidine kinase KdpD
LVAATLSAISLNFLFIEPRLTFSIAQVQDVILFLLYFAIAIFTGNLTSRLRSQERQTRHNAERTSALYALAHETATAADMDTVLSTAVSQIGRVFDADVSINLRHDNQLQREPHPSSTLEVNDKEYSVIQWVYERGKSAGRFTETLAQATAQYHPLQTPTRIVGVIGIRLKKDKRLAFDQEVLLETFLSQVSLAIERELLDEAAEQTAMLRESERLQSTLLNSISHELRTPIATLKGASSSLMDPIAGANESARAELTRDIQSAADRLNRLVENLLDMSRLESGRLEIKREWCDVGDLIGVAVKQVDDCARKHPLSIHIDPDLPLIKLDFVLIEQVLVNLLDNACNYTAEGTAIRIAARVYDTKVEISVSDEGQGIPEELRERIFDKFYRLPGTASGGTGLGLSISRGLVEAHGGRLTAENAAQGGATFTIHLPRNGTPPPVQEAQHG